MTHEETSPPRLGLGICICLAAYVFFVIASSLVWDFQDRFPTIQVIFIQNCISLICILPIALRKGVAHLKTTELSEHLIRDVMGVLSYYLYFLAIRFFLGFIGVAVILNPTRQIFQLGFLLGLFAGIISAVSFCAIRVLNLKKEPMSRTLFYYFLTGCILSFPFAWIYWVQPTTAEWLQAISIGAATAIGQIFLTIAYRYGTASYLSPLGYSTVVYAALSSWIFFDRPLSFRSLIGTVLIIFGGTLTYILKKHPENIAETFKIPNPGEKPPL
jgi:drug/metabolite transporter (DMT)-like permease